MKVGKIVGRDTDHLDSPEVTRATVETIAENTIDGIVSPLFFFAIGGLPLAVVYRAANTLDSMIGYKTDKYIYFGRVAARVDDVLNYIPARICALLFIAAAACLGYDAKGAWRIMRRDASKHPSPNGGYAEATVAGALGIRLGGHNRYFGKDTFREYMGDADHELEPQYIRKAMYLMYSVSLAAGVITALLHLGSTAYGADCPRSRFVRGSDAGLLAGRPFLVTCPIDRYSTVVVRPGTGRLVGGGAKACRALALGQAYCQCDSLAHDFS